jgi:hypothetical protein
MQLRQVEWRNFRRWAEPPDAEAIREVVKGAIIAVGAHPDDVAVQAVRAAGTGDRYDDSSREEEKKVKPGPVWHRATDANLSTELLIRALMNPLEAVAASAAELLGAGVGGQSSAELLSNLLMETQDAGVLALIAEISDSVWQEHALEQILARLSDSLTPASSELFPALTDVIGADTDPRSLNVLVRSLTSERAIVVARAAEALQKGEFVGLHDRLPEIHQALQHWLEHGTECVRHGGPVQASSCPSCYRSLPDPCTPLARILADNHDLQFAEAHKLVSAPFIGARDVGVTVILGLCAANPEILRETLNGVGSGSLPQEVLDGVLKIQGDKLIPMQSELLTILKSENEGFREQMVRALPLTQCGCLTKRRYAAPRRPSMILTHTYAMRLSHHSG